MQTLCKHDNICNGFLLPLFINSNIYKVFCTPRSEITILTMCLAVFWKRKTCNHHPMYNEFWQMGVETAVFINGFLQPLFRNSNIYTVFWILGAEIAIFTRMSATSVEKYQYWKSCLHVLSGTAIFADFCNLRSGKATFPKMLASCVQT